MKKKINYRRQKQLRKKNLLKRRVIFFSLLGFMFLASATYLFFFSSLPKIKSYSILPQNLALRAEIGSVLEESIREQDNLLLFSAKKAKAKILLLFPEIEEIFIKKTWSSNLDAFVISRTPVLIVCKTATSSACFLEDKNQVLYQEVRENPNDLPLVFIKEDSPLEAKTSQMVLSIDNFFKTQLKIEIGNFVLEEENLLRAKTPNFDCYFDQENKEDLNLVLNKLKLLLEEEIAGEDLEYIDLRFSKVYYK